jgi:RNA 3'-terminal phosphate cyclase (ATP)
MIEIDGSAGGQILRTSLALSALTLEPVTVFNIRIKRPNPGLQAQHLSALNVVGKLCNAKIRGNKKGSKKIVFIPKKIRGGQFTANIGTAGSISLVLQTIMLPSIFSRESVSMRLIGGTDVKWAPPFDYLKHVLIPTLNKMGARFQLNLIRRGYFPEGNGLVLFKTLKQSLPLKPLKLITQGKLERIELFSHCRNLPREVALNQTISAKKVLSKQLDIEILEKIQVQEGSYGSGSGITIVGLFSNNAVMGASFIGEKNSPAVKVGEEAAKNFLKEFSTGKPVDSFLADQLIPFLAIANGTSKISVSLITEHTLNNIKVVESFLKTKIIVSKEENNSGQIIVKGIALKE